MTKKTAAAENQGQDLDAWLLSALLLLAVVPFLNILRNNFVLDDIPLILQNPYVHSFKYLGKILGSSPWSFEGAQGSASYYRPLVSLELLICYKMFGPLAYGFHLASITLHAGVTVVLFFLTERLFGSRRIAFVAASLFAVHPIHTEAVAWIASVPDLQVCFFLLLTLFLFIGPGTARDDRQEMPSWGWKRQLPMAGAFALALLAKEPAVTLPVLAMAYEHFLRSDREKTSMAQKASRYGVFWFLVLGYLALRWWLFRGLVSLRQDLNWHETIASGLALLAQHMKMLVWPTHLTAYYPFEKTSSLWSAPALAGGMLLAGCGCAIYLCWKRARPAAFAVLWILVTLALVLNARWMVTNPFAERYLYLPSAGFCWLLAWAGVGAWDAARQHPVRWALPLAFSACIALSCVGTVERNGDWRDTLTLYTHALEVRPSAHVLQGNIGAEYLNRGDLDAAERELNAALQAAPADPSVLLNAGALDLRRKRYPEAIEMFDRIIQIRPTYASAYDALGITYWQMGEYGRALTAGEKAVQLAPLSVETSNHLAKMYLDLHRPADAEKQLQDSLAIGPTDEAARWLGEILLLRGQNGRAEKAFRVAIEQDPFDSRAHFGLAAICRGSGRLVEASDHYQAGLAFDPRNTEALSALQQLQNVAR